MFDITMLFSALVFVSIDFFYLNFIKGYFKQQIQNVQGSPVKLNFLGVVLCYIFLIAGLQFFIIQKNRPVSEAFLLGLVIYGVYETTNYALFKNWSIFTVFIDTLWGGIVFALTTYLMQWVRRYL